MADRPGAQGEAAGATPGEDDRRHAPPVGLFLFFAGRVIRIRSYPTPGLCLLSLPVRAEPQER